MNFNLILAMMLCCTVLGQRPIKTLCSESEIKEIKISAQTCFKQKVEQMKLRYSSNQVSEKFFTLKNYP